MRDGPPAELSALMSTVETVETKVFDPAELFAQLSRLLTLYLARAEDSDALANMAPKDALACAKTVMTLMADLQGGKPASVDEHTQWPRLEISPVGRGLRAPPSSGRAIRELPLQSGLPTTNNQQPISSLEDAIAAVCYADEETQALEPWARLVARIDELCIHIQKQLDEAPQRVGGAHQRRSENGDCEKGTKSRASEPGLPSVSTDDTDAQPGLENPDSSFGDSSRPSLPATRYCGDTEAADWDPGDNGEPPDESCTPTSFQLIESAGADEVSENDNGNNTDFPARHNPRGP